MCGVVCAKYRKRQSRDPVRGRWGKKKEREASFEDEEIRSRDEENKGESNETNPVKPDEAQCAVMVIAWDDGKKEDGNGWDEVEKGKKRGVTESL